MKINKRLVAIIILPILFVVSIFSSIYIYWNNLEFSKKYSFQLQKARSLLQDEYSKEVFDYAVDLMNSYPNFLPRHDEQYILLTQKGYSEMKNPNVPIHKGDVVIDGGVSTYIFVEEMFYKMVGKEGRIIGFEPDLDRIFKIKKQLRKYDNAQVHPFGLWKSNTTKKLWRYDFEYISSIKKSGLNNYKNFKKTDSIDVKLIKLDDFVKKHNIKKLDYIRLNIEGSELEALIGARNTLKTLKPKLYIGLEHYPEEIFNIILYLDSLKLGYKFYMGVSDVIPTNYALYAIAD